MKNDHRWNIFSNLSSRQQYLSNDIKKFRQKWLVKKSKFVWRKKNPPRAQIFRYFRIKSRNNYIFIAVCKNFLTLKTSIFETRLQYYALKIKTAKTKFGSFMQALFFFD